MRRSLRQLLITSLVTTVLLAGTAVWTAVTASAATNETCLNNTRLNSLSVSGSPFTGGTRISWHVTMGCPDVVVALGAQLGAIGSTVVNPKVTASYKLIARRGTMSRILGTRTALGGKVVEYYADRVGLVPTGPSGADGAAATEIAHRITSTLSEAAKTKLVGRVLEVHIIPAFASLVSLPPWKHLAGTTTCQGVTGCVEDRPWSQVRGIGGTTADGKNYVATAVGAEELTYIPSRRNQHRLGHILAHELSHVFLQDGLTSKTFRDSVRNVLNARGSSADYLGLDSYTRSSVDEYWAEGSAALFRYAYGDQYVDEFTPEWLAQNDPALLAKLNIVYANR